MVGSVGYIKNTDSIRCRGCHEIWEVPEIVSQARQGAREFSFTWLSGDMFFLDSCLICSSHSHITRR